VEQALLPAAFEFEFALKLLILTLDTWFDEVKSSGQECPLHTGTNKHP
jgi:hypothetical protein